MSQKQLWKKNFIVLLPTNTLETCKQIILSHEQEYHWFSAEFTMSIHCLLWDKFIEKAVHVLLKLYYFPIVEMTTMDLSPIRQNFEKNRNRQKYHHSLKEHPTFTKIAKFGCEML